MELGAIGELKCVIIICAFVFYERNLVGHNILIIKVFWMANMSTL